MKKLRWCLKIKDGIRIKKPSDEIARSYLELSKSSLRSAETVLKKNDLIWSTVMIYYAEYYALYSFLLKLELSVKITSVLFYLQNSYWKKKK